MIFLSSSDLLHSLFTHTLSLSLPLPLCLPGRVASLRATTSFDRIRFLKESLQGVRNQIPITKR